MRRGFPPSAPRCISPLGNLNLLFPLRLRPHPRPPKTARTAGRSEPTSGGVTAVVFLLSPDDIPALYVQLYLMQLSTMERIHSHPHRQDRVEVVALPFHPALVEVAAGLYRDEPHLQQCADTFHRGVLRQTRRGGDGVVAWVAGVRPAVLNQQQIGADHKRRGREPQQKYLVGQSKKFFVFALERRSTIFADGFLS